MLEAKELSALPQAIEPETLSRYTFITPIVTPAIANLAPPMRILKYRTQNVSSTRRTSNS